MLLRCWNEEPYIRPTFTDLVQQLDSMLSKMTSEVYHNSILRFFFYACHVWSTNHELLTSYLQTGIRWRGRSNLTNATNQCTESSCGAIKSKRRVYLLKCIWAHWTRFRKNTIANTWKRTSKRAEQTSPQLNGILKAPEKRQCSFDHNLEQE